MLYKSQRWRCLHTILIYSNDHLRCGRSHPAVHLSHGGLLRLTSIIRVPDQKQLHFRRKLAKFSGFPWQRKEHRKNTLVTLGELAKARLRTLLSTKKPFDSPYVYPASAVAGDHCALLGNLGERIRVP